MLKARKIYHFYKGLDRDPAQRMDEHLEIKEKYTKYLKEYELYDKLKVSR